MSAGIPTGYHVMYESNDDLIVSKFCPAMVDVEDTLMFSYDDLNVIRPFVEKGFGISLLWDFSRNRKIDTFSLNAFTCCYSGANDPSPLGEIYLTSSLAREQRAMLQFQMDQDGLTTLPERAKRMIEKRDEARTFAFPSVIGSAVREYDRIVAHPFLDVTAINPFISYHDANFPDISFSITAGDHIYTVYPGKIDVSTLEEALQILKTELNKYRLKGLFK